MTITQLNRLPVFFIVGAARSGTTMLRTIFDSHPQTLVPLESKLIIHLKNKYKNKTCWNEQLVSEFVSDLFADRKMATYWQIDRLKLTQSILEIPQPQRRFDIICKLIYLQQNSLFPKSEIILIGDKNPVYSIFIFELLEVFPNAKFIHLVRDYRDVILSNRSNFKRNDLAVYTQYWKVFNRYIESAKRSIPQHFFTLRYEDLVSSPETNIKNMCQFLEIDFYPSMLQFGETIRQIYKPEEHTVLKEMFPGLMEPITEKGVGKWKSEFNKEEIKIIEGLIGGNGIFYGYSNSLSEKKSTYFFKSMKGFFVQMLDIAIMKGYYFSPFSWRNFVRKIGDFLFHKFGYLTTYNEDDRLKEIIQKRNEN